MNRDFLRPTRTVALTLLLALAACATAAPPNADEEEEAAEPNDPLENVNRAIFDFNLTLDRYALKPVAQGYRDYVPDPIQSGIRNVLNNLRSPIVFVNDLLQGDGKRAGDTFARLWINTVMGLGGIMDVATDLGIPYHSADFGQTLGIWGVPAGPYLMLPILGPSNPRDTVGLGAEFVSDPFNILTSDAGADYAPYVRATTNTVDARSRNIEIIDQLEKTSLDFYATVRSLSTQRRAAEIRKEDQQVAPGVPRGP
jgi:phospholipid-binding lipoprotein MlaA